MKRLHRARVIVVALTMGLPAPAVSAQSEKVSVRMAPQPGQSVRIAMTQEMDFDIGFDGSAPAGFPGMKMEMRVTIALTQKTGQRKPDGTIDAELTYQEFRTEMSMNGQATPADSGSELIGRVVTVTYNPGGEIVNVSGLPPGGVSDDSFRELLGSLTGNLPTTPVGVGETITVPLDVAMPLPLPGAGPLKLDGENRMRLVAIDKDAQGRSARFESIVSGKLASNLPSPDGSGSITMDITMTGQGTTVMDLDKGLPRSNESMNTVDGRITMPAGAPAGVGGMTLSGTVKMTMTSK